MIDDQELNGSRVVALVAAPMVSSRKLDSPFKSQKRERAEIVTLLRAQGKSWVEIAETFRKRYRVNARVAFRYAHGWSQVGVADEWCRRWPEDLKTAKVISTWEVWPSSSGHAPSLSSLARLAELYKCSVGDLLVDLPSYREAEPTNDITTSAEHNIASVPGAKFRTEIALPEFNEFPRDERGPEPPTRTGVTPRNDGDPMHRRNLITWGMSTIAASSLGGIPRDTNRVRQVGVSDVDQISNAAVRLRNLGHLHGGESLWRAALALASDGYLMLEQGFYDETTGMYLQKAIGRAEMCAGWLAFDAGRHETARSSFNEALSLARQTSDPIIETHALVNLSFQSNFLGMPRQALRFANAADRVAKGVVAKMEIVPDLRRASAHAQLGDSGASGNAIRKARNLLDRDADKITVEWCNFLTPAELDGVEGTCALRLGDAKRAETLLEQAVAAHTGKFARNLALYRVRLATAQLNGRSAEAAATSATIALDDLGGELASSVVTTELHHFANGVSRYRGIAEVDTFEHRYALSELGTNAQGRREH